MNEPWLRTHRLRDFALAGNINNISDLRSNLMRDSALTLPVPPASGRSAEYPYYHGVELYLHSALSPSIGRQNAILAVRFLFGLVGETLRKELDKLPDREREDIYKAASARIPERYTLGLVCRKPDALGPAWWVSRDMSKPTNIGVVTGLNGTFTFEIDPEAKASELVAYMSDRVHHPVLGITVVNLTRLMVPFDDVLDRRKQWNSGSFLDETEGDAE
jgi:hypothetical protein